MGPASSCEELLWKKPPPKRSLLVTVSGSRGDYEPHFALSLHLLARKIFDEVHLCVQKPYDKLVPSHPSIVTHVLPFSKDDQTLVLFGEWAKEILMSPFRGPPDSCRSQSPGFARIVQSQVVPSFSVMLAAACACKPSLIISGFLNVGVAYSLAQHFNVPMAVTLCWPMSATPEYPYMMTHTSVAKEAGKAVAAIHRGHFSKDDRNLETYDKCIRIMFQRSLPELNSFRADLALPPMTVKDHQDLYRGEIPTVHVWNMVPEVLFPRSQHWPSTVQCVGPLADDFTPPEWDPAVKCPKLCEYLAAGEKPFCVSFGSMVVLDKKWYVTRQVFSALRAVGLKRIVLLKSDTDLGSHNLFPWEFGLKAWARKHVHFCDERVQYNWLFPQCSGLLCHGGAGTILAGLRAGLPLAICPLAFDQFFWAQLINDMDLGRAVWPILRTAWSESYQDALEDIIQDDFKHRSALWGKKWRALRNGRELTTEIVERILAK